MTAPANSGRLGDLVIATEPERDLLDAFDRYGGAGKPRVGRLPVCYDTDRDAAVARAHEQFRWALGGWKVNAELPGTAGFEQARTRLTRPGAGRGYPGGAGRSAGPGRRSGR